MSLSWLPFSGVYIELFAIIVVTIAVAFISVALRRREYLMRTVVSFYIAGAIMNVLPVAWIGDGMAYVGTFMGLILIILLLGSHVFWAADEWKGRRFSWQFAIFSLAAGGMILSVVLGVFATAHIPVFLLSDVGQSYFIGEMARFFWMIAPIVSAVILRR